MNPAGLARRLGAMFYDGLLLAALLMIAGLAALPLTGGAAVADQEGRSRTLMQLWFLFVWFGFFTWFWTHGGQTLGMKAWRLQLQTMEGVPLRWKDAVRRFAFAVPSIGLAGVGLWWIVFDRDRLALHDRLSRTRMVLLPRPQSA